MTIQSLMDSLTAAGTVKEMIVVLPTARNTYAGSYYANSPVTGNWEDFLSRELVAWVDSAFRTLPQSSSRGIAGHSMGGYGAITLAMRHPGVFGAAYALSPCCLGMAADIGPDNPVWKRMDQFKDIASLQQAAGQDDLYPIAVVGFAAVISPNTSKPPFYVDLPFGVDNGSVRPVEPVLARWKTGLPLGQVAGWRDSLSKLRTAIRIDYGFDDQFAHIPPTVQMFADSLAKYRVPYRLEAYNGDHRNRIRARMTTIVLPFFSAALLDR
jgi:S-formylglutathione hydrolase FrmB